MYFNGFKIVELKRPERGDLQYCDKMKRHPDIGPLRYLVVKGEISVLVSGFCDTPKGRVLQFSPIGMPGVKRYALRKFFKLDNPSDL